MTPDEVFLNAHLQHRPLATREAFLGWFSSRAAWVENDCMEPLHAGCTYLAESRLRIGKGEWPVLSFKDCP